MSFTFGWLAILALLSSAQAICYFPDGTPSSSDSPCLDGEGESFCCGYGFACLSNRVCAATSLVINRNGTSDYVRGSCTDETFRAAECPSFCVNGDDPWLDYLGGGEGMNLCSGTTNTFYCNDFNTDAVDCSSNTNVFVLGNKAPSILRTIGVDGSSTSSAPAGATGTTMNGPSKTMHKPATASASSTGSAGQGKSSNESGPSNKSDSTSTGTIAGAAVGGAAGVALIGAAVWYILRRNKKKKYSGLDGSSPSMRYTSPAGQHELGQRAPEYSAYSHYGDEVPKQPYYAPGMAPAAQTAPYEVYAPHQPPPELDGSQYVSELPDASSPKDARTARYQ